MKVKARTRRVRCDVCGTEAECDPDDRGSSFRGHEMMVLSVHDPAFTTNKYPHDHRRFYDICSMACLVKFANYVTMQKGPSA